MTPTGSITYRPYFKIDMLATFDKMSLVTRYKSVLLICATNIYKNYILLSFLVFIEE